MNGSRVLRTMDNYGPSSSSAAFDPDDRADRASYTSSICEITDSESRGSNTLFHTTTILRVCRQQVLKPYWKLLFVIGWRPFGRDRINYHCGWKMINIIYPLLLVGLMFYVYIYRILSCQGKYDVLLITIPSLPAPTLAVSKPTNFTLASLQPLNPAIEDYHICDHLITSYVLPDVVHFVAYLLGFWYFRIQDNEQMDALIQQAFLHATPIQHGSNTQSMMIKTMKWTLVGGALWVLGSMGVFSLFLVAFGFNNTIYPFTSVRAWNIVLLCVNVFGYLIYNSIIAAVVVNYAVQCETIICFMRSIQEQLLEKTRDLRMIMHDILKVCQATHQLNGPMAKMMSLFAFNFAGLVIVGLSLLLFDQHNGDTVDTWIIVYRVSFLSIWLIILIFPFIQAARLNSIYSKFEQAALDMRVFGYLTNTQQELDSFLQFVARAKCQASLLFLPVGRSNVYGTILLTIFILIIMVQTGIIVTPYTYL